MVWAKCFSYNVYTIDELCTYVNFCCFVYLEILYKITFVNTEGLKRLTIIRNTCSIRSVQLAFIFIVNDLDKCLIIILVVEIIIPKMSNIYNNFIKL